MKSTKAGVQWPLIALFFLLGVALLITSSSLSSIQNTIGKSQYELLMQTEQAVAADTYISFAAKLSAQATKDLFLQSAGIYQEGNVLGQITPSRCGAHLYTSYTSKTASCIPTYERSITQYFDDQFSTYLQQYKPFPLRFLYSLNLAQKNSQELVLETVGEELSLPFARQQEAIATIDVVDCSSATLNQLQKQYPKTALGFYGEEKNITCATGTCFSQVAQLLFDTYEKQKKTYSYVRGGESPYCPQHVRDQAQRTEENLFTGVTIHDDTFLLRTQQLPGFDSAGWLWWVGKHADVSFFNKRLGEAEYFTLAKPTFICEEQACTLAFLLTQAQEGDIIFARTEERYTEDGDKTLTGSIFMALYVGIDSASGRPIIIHADPLKGLVKELLPEKFATGTTTHIAGVYRLFQGANQASGHATIPTELAVLPPFIGPFGWCGAQTTDLPSNTYQKQIQEQPFNSAYPSYFELFVATAIEQGIDPALLATHAVLETSMGRNDKCPDKYQKSSLTGCAWPGTCSAKCGCTGNNVLSDDAQIACTARTDLGAYKEAIAGVHSVVGLYEECKAYEDTPEILWNCIFCIYQGSYDKVIGEGNLYFKKDQTCAYAQKAKKEYCSWRNYFDQEWDDLSALTFSTVTSSLRFKPSFSTTTLLDLPTMNLITEEFVPSLRACNNDLTQCVQTKIIAFNTKHNTKIQISQTANKELFAHSFAEELLDCRLNEQKDCICPISPTYFGLGTSSQTLQLFSNGSLLANETFIYQLPFNPTLLTGQFFSSPVRITILANAGKEATFTLYNATNPRLNRQAVLAGPWHLQTPYQQTSVTTGQLMPAFGLLKQTYSSMSWTPYVENVTHLTCRDNKHYFNFQATILTTNQVINFSIYLDDTIPENLQAQTSATPGVCAQMPSYNPDSFNPSNYLKELFSDPTTTFTSLPDQIELLGLTNTITLQWETMRDTYLYHAFIVQVTKDPSFSNLLDEITLVVANAQTLTKDITEPPTLDQLFYTTNNNKATFFYKLNSLPSRRTSFAPGETYYYRIIPVDHYLHNGTPTNPTPFTFTDPYAQTTLLSKNQLELLRSGTSLVFSGNPNILCIHTPQVKLTTTDLLGSLGHLRPHPEYINPENNESLFIISDIPNVVCDETDTSVGKFCAGTKELVEALHRLSPELESKNQEMIITQAFRTWDIQYKLWQLSGFDRSMACDPKTKDKPFLCPHMIAGAIDLRIQDTTTKQRIPYLEQEAFMCSHGFVRYGKEWWHFELGTRKYDAAETARASGSCCYYGARHPEDTREQTCSI